MLKNIKKESYINLLTSIALGAILMYLTTSFGELVSLFQVFPLIVLFLNEGLGFALISLTSSLLFGLFFVDPLSLAYMALFMLFASLFAGYSLKNKKPLDRTILYTAFIKLALLLGLMAAMYYFTKENPIETFKSIMYKSIEDMKDSLGLGLDLSKEEIQKVLDSMRKAVDTGIEIIPAILFMISYATAFVNIILALKVVNKSDKESGYVSKVNSFGPGPDLKIVSLIFSLVSIAAYIVAFKHARILFLNLMSILAFFYFFHGLFLTDFVYEKSGRKIMRYVVPFILVIILRSTWIYLLIGFMDMMTNIRERIRINGNKQ